MIFILAYRTTLRRENCRTLYGYMNPGPCCTQKWQREICLWNSDLHMCYRKTIRRENCRTGWDGYMGMKLHVIQMWRPYSFCSFPQHFAFAFQEAENQRDFWRNWKVIWRESKLFLESKGSSTSSLDKVLELGFGRESETVKQNHQGRIQWVARVRERRRYEREELDLRSVIVISVFRLWLV